MRPHPELKFLFSFSSFLPLNMINAPLHLRTTREVRIPLTMAIWPARAISFLFWMPWNDWHIHSYLCFVFQKHISRAHKRIDFFFISNAGLIQQMQGILIPVGSIPQASLLRGVFIFYCSLVGDYFHFTLNVTAEYPASF